MRQKNFNIIRLACTGLLCTVLSLSQPALIYATQLTPTPTPDPHTEAYYQAAETDSIEGWPEGPQIEAEAAVLMEAYTDTILYSKNSNEQLYPASITKIMTTLLACENLDIDDSLVVSYDAAYGIEAGSSSIYADADEEFTVEQALMAVMLESANEMAVAVAEKTSGSVKKFCELMNRRAAQLGCTNTHFNNPNGLPDENHYTTASDMAKIAKAAWFNPLFRKFCTEDVYEIPPTNKFSETRYLLNHHKMMEGRDYAYDGVLGGKTGYTEAAGNTLVTFARRGDTILIAVVLGSVNGAWSDTQALLDYGFDNFERIDLNVDKKPVPVKTLPCEQYILTNNGDTYPFYYIRRVYVTVPVGTDTSVLTKKQAVLQNAAGPLRMKSKYYFNGHMVGWGMQYEQDITSGLLLDSQ
jgi:D-alanyl-D-alanine carboxypeptidase (penicillin-binding protein 5/6)